MYFLPILFNQMSTLSIVLITLGCLALMLMIFLFGLNRGIKAGIDYGMRYAIEHTLDNIRKDFYQKGYGPLFDDIVEHCADADDSDRGQVPGSK